MTRTTAVAIAVPSVLERYGAGWDDEPPYRSRITPEPGSFTFDGSELFSIRCLSGALAVAASRPTTQSMFS